MLLHDPLPTDVPRTEGSPVPLADRDGPAVHTAPCGGCGRLLRVTEEELLASLDQPVTCWPCVHQDELS